MNTTPATTAPARLLTPAQRDAVTIVHAGLAQVRAWLGETTPEQAAGDAYQPRHGKTVTTKGHVLDEVAA